MLSDSIFDTVEETLEGLAQFEADGTHSFDDLLKIVDSLAEFSARGTDLDTGGDGLLDIENFVDENAYNEFLNDVKERLRKRFKVCVGAHYQYD